MDGAVSGGLSRFPGSIVVEAAAYANKGDLPEPVMMQINKIIKARRERLGMDNTVLAKRAGLSDMEYYDVEAYDHELATVTPLMNVRRLAEALDLPLHELFGIAPPKSEPRLILRDIFIKEARQRIGISTQEMADQIGFDLIFVNSLEGHYNYLELYPYAVLEIVANILNIAPQDLLYIS